MMKAIDLMRESYIRGRFLRSTLTASRGENERTSFAS